MAGIRARSRPRVRSLNFRRLWWVLEREAILRVMFPSPGGAARLYYRRVLAKTTNVQTHRLYAWRMISFDPRRQFWSPAPGAPAE